MSECDDYLVQENEEAVIILLGAIQHWCIAQYSKWQYVCVMYHV